MGRWCYVTAVIFRLLQLRFTSFSSGDMALRASETQQDKIFTTEVTEVHRSKHRGQRSFLKL
jgi:hypothetical protein